MFKYDLDLERIRILPIRFGLVVDGTEITRAATIRGDLCPLAVDKDDDNERGIV